VKVVCNTSPLLFLAKIQRLPLLTQLYTTILVPGAVLDELGAKPERRRRAQQSGSRPRLEREHGACTGVGGGLQQLPGPARRERKPRGLCG
jgi:hypothetical protein